MGVWPPSTILASNGMRCAKRLHAVSMSCTVRKASINNASTPHSKYCSARSNAASKPSTATASVRANIKVLLDRRASKAARNLPCISLAGITPLPCKCPHRLGNVWSSSWIMLAPQRSNSNTVRRVLSAFPKPVSASTMMGNWTRSAKAASVCATSDAVTKPISDRPNFVYAIEAPDKYKASKPDCSAIKPLRESYTPGASTARFSCKRFLKSVMCYLGYWSWCDMVCALM